MKNEPSQDPAPGARGGGAPASPNLGGPRAGDTLPIKEGWGSKDLIALGEPSPATRQGAHGKGVAFFADVHRKAKNGEGYRITFTTDGLTFKHVDDFEDLPAKDGDNVIPLQHTDGVIGLLKRGVDVYYLRRTSLIAKRREELKLSKTTRKDIKALMSIEERWFRKVSEDFLVMRRMVATYRTLQKTHQQLLNKYKAVSDTERYAIKPAIRTIEEQMDELATKISEEAGRRCLGFNKVVFELNIENSLSAKEALAELITYIDFANSPLRGLKKVMGLYKPVRSRKNKHWRLYDGRLHQAINRLAMSYYGAVPTGRQCWTLVKKLKQLLTENQTQG